MAASSIRVLVVDDFEPFRRVVAAILRKQPELHIISEVSDGLEAVQRAEELQPDLILLDIGLPTLNGIAAARQIRKRSPKSKILFVSESRSADIPKEAFRTGAGGYVVKSNAASELLPAVEAVLHGKQFVSASLAGHDSSGSADSQASDGVDQVPASPAPALPRKADSTHRHEALFYSDDALFLDHLTQFIGAALSAGNAAIVVSTESHRNSLLPRLQAYGLDVGAAIEQGRYIAADAASTLSTFMVNGMPDPARFLELLGDLIVTATEAAKGKHPCVSVFGECVHLLWAQGNAEAAIQMEKLGNQLAKIHDVNILCGYSVGGVQGDMDSHIFQRICAEHSAVYSQ